MWAAARRGPAKELHVSQTVDERDGRGMAARRRRPAGAEKKWSRVLLTIRSRPAGRTKASSVPRGITRCWYALPRGQRARRPRTDRVMTALPAAARATHTGS